MDFCRAPMAPMMSMGALFFLPTYSLLPSPHLRRRGEAARRRRCILL